MGGKRPRGRCPICDSMSTHSFKRKPNTVDSNRTLPAAIIGALIASLVLLISTTAHAHSKPPVKIILDTDFGDDGDDLAALCVLHHMVESRI